MPDGSEAVIRNGAVRFESETVYVPLVPEVAEADLPLASVTVTVAPVSAVPMATVPVIDEAVAVED